MIFVVVRKHDMGDIGKIDFELSGVVQHRGRSIAGVEEQFESVRFYQGRETPFSDAAFPGVTGQIGRKDGDPKLVDEGRRGG